MSETEAAATQRRHILVAVDQTEASEWACRWTVDHFLREGDEVHLFHVVPLFMLPGTSTGGTGGSGVASPGSEDTATESAEIQQATAFIDSNFVTLLKPGTLYKKEIVRHQTGATTVAQLLCERAKELDAAVVVVASHNKGPLKQFLLGSTTSYCGKHCPQPLVIVH